MRRAQFDAYAFYKSLRDAGVSPEQALVHAEALNRVTSKRMIDLLRVTNVSDTENTGLPDQKPGIISSMLKDKRFLVSMTLNFMTWCIVIWAVIIKSPQ